MIIHTDMDLEVGKIVYPQEDERLYKKGVGHIKMPPFLVIREATKEEYIAYITEEYGEEYLPSPTATFTNFYLIHTD